MRLWEITQEAGGFYKTIKGGCFPLFRQRHIFFTPPLYNTKTPRGNSFGVSAGPADGDKCAV